MNVNQILAHFSENQVAGFMLVLARVSPLFLLAPLFSSKMLPARARGIVAVIAIAGPWMLSTIVDWTTELWQQIPLYVGS